MPVRSLRNLIDWRLLALHQLAAFCFVIGVRQLWLLLHFDMLNAVKQYGTKFFEDDHWQRYYDSFGEAVTDLQLWETKATLAALALGCLLSLVVALRQRKGLLTPLFILLIGIVLNWHKAYDAAWLWACIRWLRQPLESLADQTRIGVTAFIFIIAGIAILLSTWPWRSSMRPVHAQL